MGNQGCCATAKHASKNDKNVQKKNQITTLLVDEMEDIDPNTGGRNNSNRLTMSLDANGMNMSRSSTNAE